MDIETLLVSNGAHLLLYFFALLLMTAFTPRAGMKWFAASYGFLAVGDLLIMERGHISPFLSIIVGNVFILLGFALQHKGALQFMGEGRKYLSVVLGSVPVCGVLFAYFAYVKPSIVARISMGSLDAALITGLTASVLLPKSKKIPSRRAIGLLLAGYSLMNTGRAIVTLWLGTPEDFSRNDRFQSLSLLIGGLVLCAILLGFTWMMNARLQFELEYAANMDVLTGVMNRRAAEGLFKEEIRRSQRRQENLTLLLLDVDYFKHVNDTWGHEAGDEVLRGVAQCILTSLREDDKVARWGGEEFCCLLPSTGFEEAAAVAERLRQDLEAARIRTSCGQTIRLTVSIGVSEAVNGDSSSTLVRRADDALYKAKRSGRNRVCLAESELGADVAAEMDLA